MVTLSVGQRLLLVVWGVIIVSGADNILRPYLLKSGIEVSMAVLLLSILCSVAVFGAVGIIAGPILAAIAHHAFAESEMLNPPNG